VKGNGVCVELGVLLAGLRDLPDSLASNAAVLFAFFLCLSSLNIAIHCAPPLRFMDSSFLRESVMSGK